MSATKRCILFVVDALSEPVVRRHIREWRLPALAKLIDDGGFLKPCTSIFPSITPAATCSIATGEYPRRHGIEAACWFDPVTNDAAYFGDDLRFALQEGLKEYLEDFGDRLNFDRLRAPLVYEHLFDAGIESACINYMWFRGPHVHSRTTPLTLKLIAGRLGSEVRGTKILKLGDFVHSFPPGIEVTGTKSGVLGRFGFDDQTTGACMLALARGNQLPPFTLAYFPNNDNRGHKVGLDEAAKTCLEDFDGFLSNFVDAIGGWEHVGRDLTILIVGDHGQVQWEQAPEVLMLDEWLSDFSIARTAEGFQNDDDLLICPNMRSAAIYLARENPVLRDQVVDRLLGHDGVDQVIYEEDRPDRIRVLTVRTADRGRVSFRRAVAGSPDLRETGHDCYGNRWSIHGELTAVDMRIAEDGLVVDGRYPNPLERIEGAFTGGPSPIWVTAHKNAALAIDGSSTHDGGSHGSLLRDDSIAALIASRNVGEDLLPVPDAPRIIDVMDLCLASLGVARSENLEPGKVAIASG